MKIYISGPMTGYENYNYPAFNDAARRFSEAGYEVVNPATLNEHLGFGMPWGDYIRRDVEAMMSVDAIAILPGWENSRGAKLEALIAVQLGMPFYDAITMEPIETPNIIIVHNL